jgi:segregation and condensation protein B
MSQDNINNEQCVVLEKSTLLSRISSLLFISHKPLSIRMIAKLIGAGEVEVEMSIEMLIKNYNNNDYGFKILRQENEIQMATDPANADLVGKFLKEEVSDELTRPSLETLTIIAYRGPISKLDLDRIRGVNCAIILRNLAIRGLVEQNINKKTKNVYYNVSIDLLRYLGLNNISDLPDYTQLNNAII